MLTAAGAHVQTRYGTGAVRVPVPAAGSYVLELSDYGTRTWRTPVVTVAAGQEVAVPPLSPAAQGAFGGEGNSVDVTRTTVLPDGTVDVRTAFRAASPVTGAVARLEVPAGTTLLEQSVLRDGRPVGGELRGGFYEVPLGDLATGASGVLRHQVQLVDVAAGEVLGLTSFLRHPAAGAVGEPVGTVQVQVSSLTLSAPRRVPSATVPVSGRAPAGASVGIFSEGQLLARTEATAGGSYSTTVELPDLGELHTHVLYAESSTSEGTTRSDGEPVVRDSSHLLPQEIAVQQADGRRVAFDPAKGVARFPYVFIPGKKMIVEARFADPSRVTNVRVRIGSREAPAALVNGVFRGEFESDGRGGVYVDYDVVGAPARADDPPGGALTEQQVRDRLPAALRDFQLRGTPTYTEDGDVRRGTFTIDMPGKDTSMTGTLEVEKDQQYTVTAQDVESQRLSGSPLYGLAITQRREGDTILLELSGHVPQDQLGVDGGALSDVVGFFTRAFSGGDDEQELTASNAGAVVETARVGYIMAFNVATNGDSLWSSITSGGKWEDIDKLYRAIDASGCDFETKEIYRKLADFASARAKHVDIANGLITLAGLALAPETFGIGTIALWGVGWVYGKVMDFSIAAQIERASQAVAAAAKHCKREGRVDLRDLEPPPAADPVWIFDPSGFVYEAVPSNRLQGRHRDGPAEGRASAGRYVGRVGRRVVRPGQPAGHRRRRPLRVGRARGPVAGRLRQGGLPAGPQRRAARAAAALRRQRRAGLAGDAGGGRRAGRRRWPGRGPVRPLHGPGDGARRRHRAPRRRAADRRGHGRRRRAGAGRRDVRQDVPVHPRRRRWPTARSCA
jgi:hypothetical protein